MPTERLRIRERPKIEAYIDVVYDYNAITGNLTKFEVEQNGFDNYDIDVKVVRDSGDDLVVRQRGGRPAIDLRGITLRVVDEEARPKRAARKRRDGWGFSIKVETPEEFRPKKRDTQRRASRG